MPSTSKKQHNFMAAIANNPSFAKKVGVPQSVGKDFSAADKGRKFGRGGMAAINKQDTKHGKMDMPFTSLKKFGGMKSGGKVKRYAGEEESLVNDRPFAETNASEERTTTREVPAEPTAPASAKSSGSTGFNAAFKQAMADSKTSGAKTFEYGGKKFALGYAKPETPAYRDEGRNVPRREAVTETVPTPAVTGRAAKESKSMPSDAQKERNAENFAKVTQGIAALTPVGRGVRTLGSIGKAATEAASASRAGRAAARAAEEEIGVGASGGARAVAARTQPPVKPPMNKSLKEAQDRIIREGRERNAFEERARDTMRGEGGFKKGGKVTKHMGFRKGGSSMKESKAMMGKEVAFMKKKGAPASMIKHEKAEMGMKKGGMPMKDGKPAFMMGKKMNMGGMAKYAKGGGIESRGKTKGTVIRMASGGSVSARADGIAQRGKTKFKMC